MERRFKSYTMIVDFAEQFDSYHQLLWSRALDKIKNSADILKNNYLTLDPTGFASFPVYINEDEIICFSGLQINSDKWDQCARINARMWIDPHYRHNYLTKMTNPNRFLNTRYLLPIQIKRAQELNIDTVFISREGDYRRFLKRYCDLILLNTGYEFTVLDHRYNVCGNIHTVPDSCCQLVAIHSFSGTINDWNTSMLKYQIL